MLNFDFSGIANLRENPLSLEDFGIDLDLTGTPIDLGFTPVYSISPGSGAATLSSGVENYQNLTFDEAEKVREFLKETLKIQLDKRAKKESRL